MIKKTSKIAVGITLLITVWVVLAQPAAYGQVYGCRDPLANNYNINAAINDGSCTYTATTYTPPVKVAHITDTLDEGSGLQMAGNYLWSFNDGGGAAAIYRIDTITNALLQKVTLAGTENVDWEDIAFDGTNFFIGDFGNNANGARTDLKIYKFPFSAIPDFVTNPVAVIPAGQVSTINFSYRDQPQPPQSTTNNHTRFDCEAMIVDNGKIHLFTKNWIDLSTTHYEINSVAAGTYLATSLETLSTNYLVTGADKANGQDVVALIGYKNTGFADHYLHLLTDYGPGKYFNGNKRQINLPNVFEMGQAEGICFRTGSYGYISNEKFVPLSIHPKLRSFDISAFVSTITKRYSFIGNGNWDTPSNWSNGRVPPVALEAGSEIMIDPAPGGQCILNVPYTVPAGATLTIRATKNFLVEGNLTIQ